MLDVFISRRARVPDRETPWSFSFGICYHEKDMSDFRVFEQHEQPRPMVLKYSEGMLLLSENGNRTKLAEMGNPSYRDYDRFLYDDERQELAIVTDSTSNYKQEHNGRDPFLHGKDRVLLNDDCGHVDVHQFFGDRWNSVTTGEDFFKRRAELIKAAMTIMDTARWTVLAIAPEWWAREEERKMSFERVMDYVIRWTAEQKSTYTVTDLVRTLFSIVQSRHASPESFDLALQTGGFELDDVIREEGVVRLFYLVTRLTKVDVSTSDKTKAVLGQMPLRLQDALIDASKKIGARFGDQLLVACSELDNAEETA